MSDLDRFENLLRRTAWAQAGVGRSVSLDQAAAILGVSRRTIYNRIRDGRLLTMRTIGGSQRVLVSSLLEMGGDELEAVLSDALQPVATR